MVECHLSTTQYSEAGHWRYGGTTASMYSATCGDGGEDGSDAGVWAGTPGTVGSLTGTAPDVIHMTGERNGFVDHYKSEVGFWRPQ